MVHGFNFGVLIEAKVSAPVIVSLVRGAEAIGGVNNGASLGGAKFGANKNNGKEGTSKQVRVSRYE